MVKKNLNRYTIRLLRKTQKFLIEEPRRFDMTEGIAPSTEIKTILEQPPCGTSCCIAGAMYVIDKKIVLDVTNLGYGYIENHIKDVTSLKTDELCSRLFYHSQTWGNEKWPAFYANAYAAATTPLQRACIGVARIEHFIATDGRE
jgi:hypothetical protein